MREELTRERLLSLMRELARTAPRRGAHTLVSAIPDSAYARYPSLSRRAVESAVTAFVTESS